MSKPAGEQASVVVTFTNRDKRECAEREVMQRRHVYQRAVAEGRMRASFAGRQIAIMEEIAQDYAHLERQEMLL